MKRINKGLDVPIANPPEQKIYDGPEIRTVAVVGTDYLGMKPTMAVAPKSRIICTCCADRVSAPVPAVRTCAPIQCWIASRI